MILVLVLEIDIGTIIINVMIAFAEITENILLLISCTFATWSNIDFNGFFLTACFCFLLSMVNDYSSSWLQFSRKNSKISLWYGGIIVPIILDLEFTYQKHLIAFKLSFALFVLMLLNISKASKIFLVLIFLIFCNLFIFDIHSYMWLVLNFAVFAICFYGCVKSFSFGEAVVSSNLLTFFLMSVLHIPIDFSRFLLTVCLLAGKYTCFFFLSVVMGFSIVSANQLRHVYLITVLLMLVILLLLNFIPKLSQVYLMFLEFIFQNQPIRLYLFIFWIFLILSSFYYAYNRSFSTNSKASTAERKLFHVFILLVYLSGLLFDIPLLTLCSILIFCFFVLTCTFCAYRVEPLGPLLLPVLQVFTDKQDMGIFIFTPVYLVFGLSFPVWFYHLANPIVTRGLSTQLPFKCFSGILAVGVGDACASVVGSKIGVIKFPGTNKTIEGTLASIIAQVLLTYILYVTNLSKIPYNQALFAILIGSVIETCTQEIDNLVLPLLTYMLLV